jgi:hypothetical protein
MRVKWLKFKSSTHLHLHGELNILYSSQNIIRQIKSRTMRWARHVAHMGEGSVQGFGEKVRRKETTWKTKA